MVGWAICSIFLEELKALDEVDMSVTRKSRTIDGDTHSIQRSKFYAWIEFITLGFALPAEVATELGGAMVPKSDINTGFVVTERWHYVVYSYASKI